MSQRSSRELKGNMTFSGEGSCHPLNVCIFVLKTKIKGGGTSTNESTPKYQTRAMPSAARGSVGASGGIWAPRLWAQASSPHAGAVCLHPAPGQVRTGPGRGRCRPTGSGQGAVFCKESATRPKSPPRAGRAPAGRMGGGSHKEPQAGNGDPGPPPASASAAAGSG
jgi:hypothetical protein